MKNKKEVLLREKAELEDEIEFIIPFRDISESQKEQDIYNCELRIEKIDENLFY